MRVAIQLKSTRKERGSKKETKANGQVSLHKLVERLDVLENIVISLSYRHRLEILKQNFTFKS